MSIRLHLTIMFIWEFLAFIAAAVVAIWLWVGQPFPIGLPLMAAIMLGLLIVTLTVPRLVFRRFIGARCPTEGCGGTARPAGSSPIRYVCGTCGHEHETSWSENVRDHHGQL